MKYARRQNLDGFHLAAHLDTGGMAYVYLATHGPGDSLAVVKILKEQFLEQPEFLAMFLEEGRLMASLQHPNVVRVLRSGETQQGLPYIAMEYLAGDHLGVLMREARRQGEELGPGLVARLALQAANGLDYVHAALDADRKPLGLVHRDISPQNIFATYDGRVKILDFGIALSVDRTVATQTGMLKGKLRYMSPEQVQFQAVDHRSDLFSLGAVLWELLTSHKLFDSRSEFQIMKAICELPLPDPRSVRPDAPAALAALTMRCLERDPGARPQRAGEVRAALLEFLSSPEGRSHPEEIARVTARLLVERKRKKEDLIASLRNERELKDFLFADLKLPEEESAQSQPSLDSTGEVLSSAPPTCPVAASRPVLEAQPEAAPAPRRSRTRLWLSLVGLVGLLGLTAGVWFLRTTGPAEAGGSPLAARPAPPEQPEPPESAPAPRPAPEPAPEPAPGPIPEPEPTLEPDPGQAPEAAETEDDEDPDNPRPRGPLGWLRLRSKPEMEAYLDGRYIGKTPIIDIKLAPGTYHIELVDRAQDFKRPVVVRIRDQEVSSYEFVF